MPSRIQAHARYREISRNLRGISARIRTSWKGLVYRCVEPKWAHPEHIISGMGSLDHGSRWMRPNLHPVVHAASTAHIALKESLTTYRYFGIRKPRQNPRLLVQIEVEISGLADLTRIENHLQWPSREDLLMEDWAKINEGGFETLAQAVGRALYNNRFAGLICNSAQDRRGRNIIWFPDSPGPPPVVQIVDGNELKNWFAKQHV